MSGAGATAQTKPWRHGTSLYGELKYPADFKQFDYVNASAAEDRHGAADRLRHLRQFQHGGRRRQRPLAAGTDLIYDTLRCPRSTKYRADTGCSRRR